MLKWEYGPKMFKLETEFEDYPSYFKYVGQCVGDVIRINHLSDNFAFLVLSEGIDVPLKNTISFLINQEDFVGRISPKLFSVSPANALASYLSIVFKTENFSITLSDETDLEGIISSFKVVKAISTILLVSITFNFTNNNCFSISVNISKR